MSKGLIIVESPAKAKTISKFLNNQYTIKASMGHVRDLPKKSLGVDLENDFKAKYVVSRDKSATIKQLKEAAKKSPEIYLASDNDREGEAIAWHLSKVLKDQIKNKPLHRITFNEITKTAIQKAIKKPGEINQQMVDAQQARRILDRIVGYKISPLLWRVISKNLSAGRVQSVALRLVCERQEKIDEFKAEEYWTIDAAFGDDTEKIELKATLVKYDSKKIEIPNQKEADKLVDYINSQNFAITEIEKKAKKTNPYPAYITSTLQQDAAKLLGFSGKKTMMVAQQLYEGIDLGGESQGLITYMRTDSIRIADEAVEAVRNLITTNYGAENLNKTVRIFKTKQGAQDAHEAIRPTDCFKTPQNVEKYLKKDQLKLYTLIWQRFVATQMNPVTINQVNVFIEAGKASFKASGSTIADKGFLLVYPHINFSMGTEIDAGWKQYDKVKAIMVKGIQHFTKPPANYTEASLIKELEAKGIGRPSTYAAITNTIIERNYIEVVQKKFIPTSLGKKVNQFLISNFKKLFNVKFTAEMELELDKIEEGNATWQSVLHTNYDLMKTLIESIDIAKSKAALVEKTDIKCDKCQSEMVIKWGKNGQFLACSNYPECKNIKNFEKDENGKIKIKEDDKLEEKCPECGNDLLIRSGRFGKFIACSNYPKCKYTKAIGTGVKCPKCDDGEIIAKRSKKGRTFYGCSKYPNCDFMSYYKPVANKCPECGNYYMEERKRKDKTEFLKCPKCNAEV